MVDPKCSFFGSCGGCTAQHIAYELQLENKKKALARYSNFPDVKVFSGDEYAYRNRMDFIFHESGLGFREKEKWWKIVDINNCPIAEQRINTLLAEIRAFFIGIDWFDVKKHTGTFRYAVIRTANDSSISFVLNSDSSRLSEAVEKIKEYAQKSTADNILVTYVPADVDSSTSSEYFAVKGNDFLTDNYLGKTFSYSIQGFFQNNHSMAEKLQAYVHNLLKNSNTKDYHLLDLYSGVGTFGIINSALFKSVTMVESFKGCIDSANENIEKNNIANAKAILLDAMQLKKLDLPDDLFVITDPPRSGMHEKTIEQLKKLRPKKIIYVSCNPFQLAKDIPKFKNYLVKSAAVFDLFPQTPHSEAVVELERKPEALDRQSPGALSPLG